MEQWEDDEKEEERVASLVVIDAPPRFPSIHIALINDQGDDAHKHDKKTNAEVTTQKQQRQQQQQHTTTTATITTSDTKRNISSLFCIVFVAIPRIRLLFAKG